MTKTIVSVSLIGPPFMDVLFREIATLASESEVDAAEVQKKIMSADDMGAVNKILKESFEDQLKIRE